MWSMYQARYLRMRRPSDAVGEPSKLCCKHTINCCAHDMQNISNTFVYTPRHLATDAQTGFVRRQLRTRAGMECDHKTEQGILNSA